ncbi:MAG: helix-turn-helix transcriptional regulator [Oligoflexales bacterium]|nr:helix-turn-helix transcriptional regulator [Oligoflexales bacterium]
MDQNSAASLIDLRLIVDEWKSKSTHRSMLYLAKKVGLTNSTLRRMLQGEATASLDKIIAVLEITAEPATRISFIQKHYPEFSSFINKTYQLTNSSKTILPSDEQDVTCNELVMQRKFFDVLSYLCAYSDKGVSLEQIKTDFGKNGINSLHELKDIGAVRESNGIYYLAIDDSTSDSNALLHIAKSTSSLLLNGDHKFFVFTHFKTVNKKGLSDLRQHITGSNEKFLEIISNDKNQGDIPINYSSFVGILESEIDLERRG